MWVKINDKYSLVHNEANGTLKAFRHGDGWRDLTGDKLMLAMFEKIVEQEQKLARDQ